MPPIAAATGIDGVTAAEIADIIKRADEDNTGQPVNRVGKLYEQLKTIIESLPTTEFSGSSVSQQARFDEWGLGQHDILILSVGKRSEALEALNTISEQGEGPVTAGAPTAPRDPLYAILHHFPHPPHPQPLPAPHPSLTTPRHPP